MLLDSWGPRVTCTTGLAFVALGCCIVGISSSDKLDLFLPGFCCLSIGAPAVHLSWFHVSNLFPNHKASVSSFVVACFVAAGLWFFAFNMLHSAGVSREALFFSHAAVVGCLICISCVLWPDVPFKLGDVPTFLKCSFPAYTVHPAAGASQLPYVAAAGGDMRGPVVTPPAAPSLLEQM